MVFERQLELHDVSVTLRGGSTSVESSFLGIHVHTNRNDDMPDKVLYFCELNHLTQFREVFPSLFASLHRLVICDCVRSSSMKRESSLLRRGFRP